MKNYQALKEKIENLQALILDMDGVLVDTEPLHKKSFALLMQESNIGYDEAFLNTLVGNSVDENVETILKKSGRLTNENKIMSIRRREAIYLELLKRADLHPPAGIESVLDTCVQNHIKLGLASSSVHEQINAILEPLHIYDRFAVIVSGEDVAEKKPAPDIYLKTVHEMKVEKKYCLAVEDSPAGAASARQAGIDCVGVTNQFADAAALEQATWLVDSVADIAEVLQQTLNEKSKRRSDDKTGI